MRELPSFPADNSNGEKRTTTLCPECQTGTLHLERLTYFTWLNEELVTVPNFPSWVCDICGRREYDARAVNWLNALLNPETGRRSPRPRTGGQSKPIQPSP